MQMLSQDIIVVLFNQWCISLPLSMLVQPYLNQQWWYNMDGTWPGITLCVYWCIGLLAIEEIAFYITHRMFHLPWCFRNIHWWHHRWIEPAAVIALSAHPIEHFASNLLPFLLGPVLLQTPMLVTLLWTGIATLNSLMAHSGFAFFQKGNHDLHHKYFRGNFGVLGVLDWLMDTDIQAPNWKPPVERKFLESFDEVYQHLDPQKRHITPMASDVNPWVFCDPYCTDHDDLVAKSEQQAILS